VIGPPPDFQDGRAEGLMGVARPSKLDIKVSNATRDLVHAAAILRADSGRHPLIECGTKKRSLLHLVIYGGKTNLVPK